MKEVGKLLLAIVGGMVIVLWGIWLFAGKMKGQIQQQNEELKSFQEERLVFRDSIEEALEHGMYSLVADSPEVPTKIDELIGRFEHDNHILLFYKTIYSEKKESFTGTLLEVQKGEREKYRCVSFKEVKRSANGIQIDTHTEVVKNFINISNRYKQFNIWEEGNNFVWGASDSDHISDLQIEGQLPDQVIPFEITGDTCYFWYYKNLESDKPYVEWEIILEED